MEITSIADIIFRRLQTTLIFTEFIGVRIMYIRIYKIFVFTDVRVIGVSRSSTKLRYSFLLVSFMYFCSKILLFFVYKFISDAHESNMIISVRFSIEIKMRLQVYWAIAFIRLYKFLKTKFGTFYFYGFSLKFYDSSGPLRTMEETKNGSTKFYRTENPTGETRSPQWG